MAKNISPTDKSSKLVSLLDAQLGKKINKARLKLIALFILALCKVQTVSFHKLAGAFDSSSKSESSLRRVQRFIAGFELCSDVIAQLIFSLLPEKTNLKLILDRTNWMVGKQNITIFMLAIAYRGVAFPLLFSLLDKKGNSTCEQRITLIERFVRLFGKDCVDCLLGDREFVGQKWIQFLNANKIRYYLRIRNNFKVFLPHSNKEIRVSWLFQGLKIGEIRHYNHIVKIKGEYCYLSATLGKKDGKPELVIIISYTKNDQAILHYKQRWQIECCFKAMKSSGFDMENTHLQDLKRIETLLCLVMIAFVWCYKVGDYLDKYVKKITIKKHEHRAKSVFKYGLEDIANCLLNEYRKDYDEVVKIFVM